MTALPLRLVCKTCNGTRLLFACPLWPACDCPGGTTRNGCPGHSKPCPDCSSPPASEAKLKGGVDTPDSGSPLTKEKTTEAGKTDRASRTSARPVRSEAASDSGLPLTIHKASGLPLTTEKPRQREDKEKGL